MGMFDTIDVRNNKLHIPYSEDSYQYQTKNLNCELDCFIFTEENYLYLDYKIGDSVDDKSYEEASLISYTGSIFIYDYLNNNETGIREVIFEITFDKGKVTNVRNCTPHSLEDLQKAFDAPMLKEPYMQRNIKGAQRGKSLPFISIDDLNLIYSEN